ncbi:MAG: endonuclease domain-containing protein [Alphaproteobacteria bacterium]|nr:endonuclease domain-containing protein [Alphaproteobacteria bacterium]
MPHKRTFAESHLIERSRTLRVASTEVEKRLWQRLRNRQLGVKFRRQHPLQGYILDFACENHKLGIELDGGQHNNDARKAQDTVRTGVLEQSGWHILRFWNNAVIENIEGVLEEIQHALTRLTPSGMG